AGACFDALACQGMLATEAAEGEAFEPSGADLAHDEERVLQVLLRVVSPAAVMAKIAEVREDARLIEAIADGPHENQGLFIASLRTLVGALLVGKDAQVAEHTRLAGPVADLPM